MTIPLFRATLDPLLADPAIIAAMEALSRRGRPAVEAIGAQLAAAVPDLGDTDKQRVGRLVRDTLAKCGWTPRRKARVAPGKLFAWGAVYDRGVQAKSGDDMLARVREAQALVASMSGPLVTVDDFIGERRREAARENG